MISSKIKNNPKAKLKMVWLILCNLYSIIGMALKNSSARFAKMSNFSTYIYAENRF
jgi:hypothetical protein